MTTMTPDALETAVAAWLAACQEKVNAHYTTMGWTSDIPVLKIDEPRGSRYWRVVSDRTASNDGRSVYCFIEPATGNILKDGGWKAPARNGVRGNLFDDSAGVACMDWHGCVYKR